MAHIDNSKRRYGNTTRQVDEWVQELFDGKEVKVHDHAHIEGNNANHDAMNMLLRRMDNEHGLKVGRMSRLVFVDYNKTTLKILPF